MRRKGKGRGRRKQREEQKRPYWRLQGKKGRKGKGKERRRKGRSKKKTLLEIPREERERTVTARGSKFFSIP